MRQTRNAFSKSWTAILRSHSQASRIIFALFTLYAWNSFRTLNRHITSLARGLRDMICKPISTNGHI